MKRMRELRKKKELSGEKLGAMVGVQKAAISKYERGQAQPSVEVLIQIANILNTSTDYLLGNTDDPTPPDAKKEAPAKAEALLVEERVDEILEGIESEHTLMLDGKPMSPESKEAFRNSLIVSVELARKMNKEKKKNEDG